MTDKLQKDAVGVAIIATLTDEDGAALDVSAATTINLIFKKPDGTNVIKTASLFNDGTDGKVAYVTETGFLDQVRDWRMQCYIELPNFTGTTDIGTFIVGGNL